MLRYRSTGEVHKDFHGLFCATLHYLIDNYGIDAVKTVLTKTAQNVYKTMHESLKNGDPEELIEFWEYYLTRENGKFSIERKENEIILTVHDCPALRHLVELKQPSDHIFCEGTKIFMSALTEGSEFESDVKSTGEFSCVQVLKKRSGDL